MQDQQWTKCLPSNSYTGRLGPSCVPLHNKHGTSVSVVNVPWWWSILWPHSICSYPQVNMLQEHLWPQSVTTQADSRIKQACTCWCGKHLPFPPHKACVCRSHRWETAVPRSHPDPPPVKAQKGHSGQDTGKRVSCNHLSVTSSPGHFTMPGTWQWDVSTTL